MTNLHRAFLISVFSFSVFLFSCRDITKEDISYSSLSEMEQFGERIVGLAQISFDAALNYIKEELAIDIEPKFKGNKDYFKLLNSVGNKTHSFHKCVARKIQVQGLLFLKIKELTFVSDCFQTSPHAEIKFFGQMPNNNGGCFYNYFVKIDSSEKFRYQSEKTLMPHQETILNLRLTVESLANQQHYLLVISGLVILFLGGLFFWWRNSEHKKQEIQSLTHLRDIAVLRMENARNRISPHFMFNMLNAVLHNNGSSEEMQEHLKAFSCLLQSNLLNLDSICVQLNQELKFVKDFVMLDNLCFESGIQYREQIDDDVDVTMLIPSMCIHIMAENALKHGLRPKEGEKELLITVENQKSESLISIIDNGVGRLLNQNQIGTGTGLKVLKQFISIINHNNTSKIRFELVALKAADGTPAGTAAKLAIPHHLNFNL